MVPSLLGMAGSAFKEVAERIPMSGFKLLDRVVFGLTTMKAEALTANLADSVQFSAVFKTSETLDGLADSVVFGVTTKQPEDLQSPLSESVEITNV